MPPKASEPEPGSVIAQEPIFSIVSSSFAQRSFWSVVPLDITAPPGDGRTVAVVRGAGAVLEEEVSEDGAIRMRVRMSPGALGLVKRKVGPDARFEAADAAAGAWLGLEQGPGSR